MRIEGKAAIVTGAAQGIGKAIATEMVKEGASVVVADIDTKLGPQTTHEINQMGPGRAIFLETDVSVYEDVFAAVDTAVSEFGKLDIMVNNAGTIIRDTVLETKPEDWARVFGVNMNGTYHGTVAAGKHMAERGGGGHILNLASPNGYVGCYNRSCYAATKGAIIAYTRCCAAEFGQYGIQVNAMAPGFTNTEINSTFFNPTVLQSLEFRIPMNRVQQPEEAGRSAVAIVSGDFPYMTGQIIYVDGGWSACDIDYGELGEHFERAGD
ncbi:MAG: short-chain dehydrogenase [Anaerolineaceae bacterium]|nr:short-chain dehydrogenase [Anaerolineaceae bacterium]